MSAMERTTKRRWAVAGGGAALVGAFVLLLFRGTQVAKVEPVRPTPKPAVTLVSSKDAAVHDESVLLDPTPLFLPTKWNATQRELPPPDLGGRLQTYDAPRFVFRESELKLGLRDPVAVPESPLQAVEVDAPSRALAGFGRSDEPPVAPQPRGAFLEIVEAGSGHSVLKQKITEVPPGKGGWQPVEFMALIDAAGLVGPLVVTTRSGVDEVDGFFTKYLARTLRIGELLGPGFYRISIGP